MFVIVPPWLPNEPWDFQSCEALILKHQTQFSVPFKVATMVYGRLSPQWAALAALLTFKPKFHSLCSFNKSTPQPAHCPLSRLIFAFNISSAQANLYSLPDIVPAWDEMAPSPILPTTLSQVHMNFHHLWPPPTLPKLHHRPASITGRPKYIATFRLSECVAL
jgi:hypothetical protein